MKSLFSYRLYVVPVVLHAMFLVAHFGNRAQLANLQKPQSGSQMTSGTDQLLSETRVGFVIGNGANTKGGLKNSPKIEATPIEFVFIPAGKFKMGPEIGEWGEKPAHRVVLTAPFWMGKYEVTQAQWEAEGMRNKSSFVDCPQCPVENVSWDDCQKFIENLNAKGDGYTYRLPTEAEWEYACRAGTTRGYAGNLDDMAWYGKNAGGKTHPVGQKKPNAWGLYDMHGNVWEWCQDLYMEYPSGSATNPTGAKTGSFRVIRGGGWNDSAAVCRSEFRSIGSPGSRENKVGFRLVRIQR